MDMRKNGHAYTFDDSVRPTPSAIISPNKATIPNPLQTAPPTGNQVLQCPRLWDLRFRAHLALGAQDLSFTPRFSRLTCAEARNSTLNFHNGIIVGYTYIPHF